MLTQAENPFHELTSIRSDSEEGIQGASGGWVKMRMRGNFFITIIEFWNISLLQNSTNQISIKIKIDQNKKERKTDFFWQLSILVDICATFWVASDINGTMYIWSKTYNKMKTSIDQSLTIKVASQSFKLTKLRINRWLLSLLQIGTFNEHS